MSEPRYIAHRGWIGRDRLAKPRNSNLDFDSGEWPPERPGDQTDNAPLRSGMAVPVESCFYMKKSQVNKSDS